MIELKHLKQVRALANEKTFNKAADALGISQPALSKSISLLERRLGHSLFHRTPKGVDVTPYGKIVLKQADDLINRIDGLERLIDLMAGMELGTINLGVGPVIAHSCLSTILVDFVNQYPKVTIKVLIENGTSLRKKVATGSIDLAVALLDIEAIPEDYICIDLDRPPRTVNIIVRSGHPLTLKKEISPSDILEYYWVTPDVPSTHWDWLKESPPANKLRVKHGLLCENFFVIQSVLLKTDLITLAPPLAFEESLRSGELVALPIEVGTKWSAKIICKPETYYSPAVKKLTTMFEDFAFWD